MDRRLLTAFALAFFVVLLLRTAWLSDAAYLTLRTADNAARGLGFGWNPTDRVQVYAHPLWMLLLTAGRLATGEVYFSSLALSLILSMLAVALVLSAAATDGGVVLAAITLALSPSFLTYSTSGLEGPLTHVLVAALAVVALDEGDATRRARQVASLAGLAALSDPLTLALTVPVAVRAIRLQPRQRWTSVGIAAGPFLAWGVIATWYYGSPIPMPAIAWWRTGAGVLPLLAQGVSWLGDAAHQDPLAMVVITSAAIVGLTGQGATRRLAFGAALYVATVVLLGGDMMSGRWLGVPIVVATILVSRELRFRESRMAVLAAAAAVVAVVAPGSTLRSDVTFGLEAIPAEGELYDARARDYPATGLLTNVRQSRPPTWPDEDLAYQAWRDPVRVRVAWDHPGFVGFAAGNGVYVIDQSGASDPLLAHLPPCPAGDAGISLSPHDPVWRRPRCLPAGYADSLPWQSNQVYDPMLSEYYDIVRSVTRGSLTDWRRVPQGVLLTVGVYDYLQGPLRSPWPPFWPVRMEVIF